MRQGAAPLPSFVLDFPGTVDAECMPVGSQGSELSTNPLTVDLSPVPDPIGPITVVVMTYSADRWDLLCDALASLKTQTRPPDETIVVVDHNQLLLEKVAAAFPTLRAVANAAAVQGISGARNTAMCLANGSIVAFLDDDAFGEPNWLAELVAPFSDPAVIVTGSRILPIWAGQPARWFPDEYGWVLGCSYPGQTHGCGAAPVRNVIGNGMAVRRLTAGSLSFRADLGRDANLPRGCEETEWCIQVSQRFPESTILQVPTATLHHHVPIERSGFNWFVRRCYAEGQSKAAVIASVGSTAGLSAERRYVARTLTSGFVHRAVRAVRGDMWALLQAGASAVGLGATVLGVVTGGVHGAFRRSAWRNDRAGR